MLSKEVLGKYAYYLLSLTSLLKDIEVSCLVNTLKVTHSDVELTRSSLTAAAQSKSLKPLGHSPYLVK